MLQSLDTELFSKDSGLGKPDSFQRHRMIYESYIWYIKMLYKI